MRWSFPHFDHQGMMCSMAAFKEHCTFGFWKPELVLGEDAKEGGMGAVRPHQVPEGTAARRRC